MKVIVIRDNRRFFLDTSDDMQWLRDTHLPGLPPEYKYAIITGNQDWPDKIEVFTKNDIRDPHKAVYMPDSHGHFQLVKHM